MKNDGFRMRSSGLKHFYRRQAVLVILVWIWMFLGSILVILLTAYIKGVSVNFDRIVDMLNKEPYLASYAEVVGVGGLPLAITLFRRDNLQIYGLQRKGTISSMLLSIPLAIVIFVLRFFYGGLSISSFNLQFPYNIWYATLGAFAYGPLESFFVIWLIVNTDSIFKSLREKFSPGLLITVVIFSLSHIILSPQAGIANVIRVAIEWLILSLIFEYTKNSIGPMFAWTLINGQVFYLVTGCLT